MPDKLKLGVIVGVSNEPEAAVQKVKDLGLPTLQAQCGPDVCQSEETLERLRAATEANGLEISTVWAGLPGPHVWNFTEGPKTIGMVPPEYRAERTEALKTAAAFAGKLGVPSITTHCGFIPANPEDPNYIGTVESLKEVAEACGDAGIEFWFETGQETPVTLLRTIEDIGTGNLGINLDPANLLMYGNGNPVDALDVFGIYVRGMHAKDGEYPTTGAELGPERPLGQGKVNFPALMPKLKSMCFNGAVTIEREISGDQQVKDIERAMMLLEPLL
ncbi:MAG TPA: sugar phosphate isomerase/epimerase family protein [Armatimonadota bacterium]|nr:sugar phosphate isomerase/epimerase family protein [Armatimonadota bacterium]